VCLSVALRSEKHHFSNLTWKLNALLREKKTKLFTVP
jgi:hypothetical protein